MNKYIVRKSLLYKTGVEYGDFTINHVEGCSHGCTYPCYALLMAKRFGKVKTYDEWIEPKIVANAEELLIKEIPKYKSKIKFVHFCFSTDPFMYNNSEIAQLTYKLIKILNDNDIRCTALTKGILPIELSKLNKNNEFGITLVSLDEEYREKFEPHSSKFIERVSSLYNLHKKGIKTWVSIEPYPTPNIIEQDFSDILDAISFTDKIVFGRQNYNSLISKYPEYQKFYNSLCEKLIYFCKKNKINYHIKNGTHKPIETQSGYSIKQSSKSLI